MTHGCRLNTAITGAGFACGGAFPTGEPGAAVDAGVATVAAGGAAKIGARAAAGNAAIRASLRRRSSRSSRHTMTLSAAAIPIDSTVTVTSVVSMMTIEA